MHKVGFWVRPLFILGLVACGGSSTVQTESLQITGNVQGLDGTLILQNNNEKEIKILKDGPFSFETKMEKGAEYSIRVLEEPCAQRCTVSEPKGKVSSDRKLNLSIKCSEKSWSEVTLNDQINSNQNESDQIDVALNSQGDAIVAWTEHYGTPHQSFKKEFRNREWINQAPISNFNPYSSDTFKQGLDMNNDGGALIGWIQSNDSNAKQVYAGTLEDGVWNFPNNLLDHINYPSEEEGMVNEAPVVKMNSKGEGMMAWLQEAYGKYQIFVAKYHNGVWYKPASLDENFGSSNSHVVDFDLDLDDHGNAILVWRQQNNSVDKIYRAEYRNTTGQWSEVSQVSFSFSNADSPDVAMDDHGNAIIVWRQSAGGPFYQIDIFKAELNHGFETLENTWANPMDIDHGIANNQSDSSSPKVAMGNDGYAVISWIQPDVALNHDRVYFLERTNGDWVGRFAASHGFSDASSNEVAVDDHGNAIIVWSQIYGDKSAIVKSQRKKEFWDHPYNNMDELMNPSGTDAINPNVVINNCRAIITWTQLNSSNESNAYIAQYR